MKKNLLVITDEDIKKQTIAHFINCASLDEFARLTNNEYSRSSLLGFTKDWNLFLEFCQLKHVSPLPASATAVRLYLEKCAENKKYATIRRYAVTISLVHRILGFKDPTANARVQSTLSGLRVNKKGDNKQTESFSREHLYTLTEQFSSSDDLQDIRNLAIYHVMFDALMKRSELKNLTSAQVDRTNTPHSIILGAHRYPLTELGHQCLSRWLIHRNHSSNYVFTAIDRHGNVGTDRLNDSSIYRVLRRASDQLGLSIAFSGQSLRVGAVKDLANQGVNTKEIQKRGRWLSPAMPYQYLGNRTQAELEKMRFLTMKPID
ncbi:tyrosine-type recombinase/integrase [Vibrio intestinalis]|uniref:tyrosine-type recombinase/integrase n=1 Tax=Vibrio intestinalis TaxID=2933291 RepID=UPI0021A51B39|nr:tyrosine-type recombinase/integrase [Vibrio intestinalis]